MNTQKQWKALVHHLGCEHLSNDKRFITRDNRKKYRKELKIELEKFLSKKNSNKMGGGTYRNWSAFWYCNEYPRYISSSTNYSSRFALGSLWAPKLILGWSGEALGSQDGSRWSQDGPTWGQDGAKMGHDGAKLSQDGSRWSQDGAKMGQYGGKMEPHWRFGGLREALERLREALGGQRKRRKKEERIEKKEATQKKQEERRKKQHNRSKKRKGRSNTKGPRIF